MNDSTSIKTIHVKNYDDKRSFDGIKILKIDKKDRHNQRLDKFAKFLDDTNEALTQRFLQLLRQNRESLEVIDENIQKHYHNLASDIFLLGHTEESLSLLLKDIKEVVAGRLLVIEQFSSGLEKIEADRAEIISAELKRLVDELVSIAHKLRDDIEHIVEAETYELNVEIIKNKAKNATLVGEFRVAQVKIDIESEKLWRNGKARWRQLMHDKALQEFLSEISSTAFTDPTDRREFLKSVQNGQLLRKRRVEEQLALLRQFTATSITSDEVSKVQNQFTAINMEEVDAIQDCYNGMLLLGETLNQRIQSRVDILRKDLHYYGALKLAPPLEEVAAELDSIVNETSLQEFFAACGGIKVDINFIAEELRSGKMIYDRNIDSILEKFEFLAVCCSMNQHFEKRKGAVEDVTSLLVKIKSCTKNEIPNTIRPLLTLLDQFADDPSLPTIFVNALLDIRKEITVELQKYEASAANLTFNPENSTKGTIKSASTKRLSSTGKSRKGERSIFFTTIDVNCLKVWSRRLGSLFLAINLPDQYKERLQSMSKIVSKQKTCNQLVEETIRSNSYEDIRLLDWKHRKLSESIATYLEVQASQISLVATNIIDFFYKVAKFTAVEKAHQTSLTDKYEDEVWDLAEDFRFEKEDKEALFDAECQKIRESIMQEELQTCFESVLQVLDEIQESYRNYHKKACFVVDKYPLVLVDSYCESLSKMRELFFIQARSNHPLLMEYQRIFDENIRLNKEFYEQNENPTGIEKRSCDAFFDPRVDKDDSLEGFDSPLLKSLSGISLTSYKGSYRILESTAHICEKFEKESFFAVPEENADNSTKDELELHLFTAAKRNLHVDHAWLSADFVLSIADKGKYDTMNEVDRDIYDTALVKNFVDLDDDNIELLSPDEKELYNFHVTLVKKLKQNARLFKDPSHVLENVPKDLSGNQWVVEVRIGPKQVQELYESIRNSCITQLETDSCTRIHVGEKLSMTRKADYTDNLEDQLRNHWPRRGRVETEIKQPREAELLSHKEKTWRHIQSIQQKVIDLQQLFTDGLTDGRKECDSYVVHMTALRTSLNNETFKNLATLQVVVTANAIL